MHMNISQNTKVSLFIVIFFISLYFLTQGRTMEYGYADGSVMYNVTRSIVEAGDFKSLVPDYYRGEEFISNSKYGLGFSLATLPFYIVLKKVADVLHLENKKSMVRRSPLFTNSVITALCCLFLFKLLLRFGGSLRNSLGLTLLYGVSTLAFVYSRSDFSEPLTGLCLLLSFYYLYPGENRFPSPWALAWSGFWLGAAMLTRPASVIVFPLWVWQLFLLASNRSFWKEKGKLFLQWGLPLLGFILIILWYNYYRYGNIFNTGYGGDFKDPRLGKVFLTGLWGLTFGFCKGLFWYNAVLLAAIPGFVSFYKTDKKRALWVAGIFLFHLGLYSGWAYWEGGWCWGPRNLVPVIPFFFIPLLFLLKKNREKAQMIWLCLGILGIAGFFTQFLGMIFPYGAYIQYMLDKGVPYEELWTVSYNSPLAGHYFLLTHMSVKSWSLLVFNMFSNPAYRWFFIPSGLVMLFCLYSGYQLIRVFLTPSPRLSQE
jgi:hypothetical protein